MTEKFLLVCAAAMAMTGCAGDKTTPTTVSWQLLRNDSTSYIQRITVKGDMSFDKLAFNAFARQMTSTNSADTITEIIPSYYAISSSRFAEGADSVVIDIVCPGIFRYRAWAPDGFHRVEADGTTTPVEFTRMPITELEQFAAPGTQPRITMADEIYRINEKIASTAVPGPYDVVPSYKKVELKEGTSKTPLATKWEKITNDNPEYYTLTVRNDSLIIGATDQRMADYAEYSFTQLVANNHKELPNAVITDYPDMAYRGLMIDISRNFQTPEAMKKFIDYMAQYRLNTLQFHLIDDEGWRLEIKKLPELTEVGARRGYTTDDSEFLAQTYCGDGNPETANTSNGYFSRDEYIDFIKYAYSRGINVIPEVETPGHARAAVKAMEKRYRATGDDTYRLIHDGDTSVYTTAQDYHDNVMNPALDGPYRFMEVVVDEIKSMYEDADVPLMSIHIGGDEVAEGAWSGSSVAQEFCKANGIENQTQLHGYFVRRIIDMMREKGVKVSGWQEIAIGHDDKYNKEVSPIVYSVDCWTSPELNVQSVSNGFPTILSNVANFYVDMQYDYQPEEPGLNWGGVVDEFQTLRGYPAKLAPVSLDKKDKVFGISGHLFSETIRNPQMVEYYIFPKMLGITERAWNNDSTYTDAQYNAVIEYNEIPRWAAEGRNFRLRQPGIIVADGKVTMNSPYHGAEIRYTTDGTVPTAQSPLYEKPFSAEGVSQVRAKLFFKGKESVISYLFIK